MGVVLPLATAGVVLVVVALLGVVVLGSLRPLVDMRLVGGATAVAALVAALLAWLVTRRIAGPFDELAQAAVRIGAGDLRSPIPHATGAEAVALAEAIEEIRLRLLRLTSEVRQGHAEADAILGGIVEGVWSVDRERRITWINAQAAERIGIRPQDALGRFCGDVLKPALPGGGRPCDDSCPILDARFRGSARATEHLVLADGRQRTVVITSAASADAGAGDRPSRQFQVLRDETDVEAARRMRDAVLANVSHEFRTPLSAQLASLEMLRERIAEHADPAVGQLVRSLERGTSRLVRLVDNLLESLRIDAGRDSIRRHPVALDDVIEEAVEQTAPLIEQKGQSLDVRLPFPLPGLVGDRPRLVQVFTNLLANANKFARQGSSVTVGGDVADGEVTIWVEDEGPGFPEEIVERPFERFSRAGGEEPEERGLGLGLWIANSIVERHGGRLVARNTGSGARVDVSLPRGSA